MIRDVVIYGNAILRTKGKLIEKFDDELRALAADMLETMYQANGVGLAAQQIADHRNVMPLDVGEQRGGAAVALLQHAGDLQLGIDWRRVGFQAPGGGHPVERDAEAGIEDCRIRDHAKVPTMRRRGLLTWPGRP